MELLSLCFLLFQLIEIVGSVLERPLIKEEFTGKYDAILGMLDKELITAEV
jgi:dynein heavy chain